MLTQCRELDLKVEASKCCLGANQALYLGDNISSAGVHLKGPSTACATAITPEANLQQAQLEWKRLSKIIGPQSSDLPKPPFCLGKGSYP